MKRQQPTLVELAPIFSVRNPCDRVCTSGLVSSGEGHSAGVSGPVVERAALARVPGPPGGTALPGPPVHAGGCRATALVPAAAGVGALQGLHHPRGCAEASALGRCKRRAPQCKGVVFPGSMLEKSVGAVGRGGRGGAVQYLQQCQRLNT